MAKSLEQAIIDVLATKRSTLWGKAFTINDDKGRREAAAYIEPLVRQVLAETGARWVLPAQEPFEVL